MYACYICMLDGIFVHASHNRDASALDCVLTRSSYQLYMHIIIVSIIIWKFPTRSGWMRNIPFCCRKKKMKKMKKRCCACGCVPCIPFFCCRKKCKKKKCAWPSCYCSNCSCTFCYCSWPSCYFRWPSCYCSNCSWAFCYCWNCSLKRWCCHSSTTYAPVSLTLYWPCAKIN